MGNGYMKAVIAGGWPSLGVEPEVLRMDMVAKRHVIQKMISAEFPFAFLILACIATHLCFAWLVKTIWPQWYK